MSSVINPTNPLNSTPNSSGGFDIQGLENQINQLNGTDATDSIRGGNLDDQIDGGKGNDAIYGLGGSDILAGGAGDDLLSGGEGNDIFIIGPGLGVDTIIDYQQGDSLELEGGISADDLKFEPTPDGNTAVMYDGETIAIIKGQISQSTVNVGSTQEILSGGDEPNKFIVGKDGFDGKGTSLSTGGGDDLIDLSKSKGAGNNEISTGDGDDKAILSQKDFAFGGGGNDVIDASKGTGDNRVYGGDGNDQATAGNKDNIAGNEGDDTLIFKGGGSTAAGGAGKDTYVLDLSSAPSEINKIIDFVSGEDKIRFAKGVTSDQVKYNDGKISVNGEELVELDGKPPVNESNDFEFM
jgi:Ca2+-binding RTX toxin-like protein